MKLRVTIDTGNGGRATIPVEGDRIEWADDGVFVVVGPDGERPLAITGSTIIAIRRDEGAPSAKPKKARKVADPAPPDSA